MGYEKNLKKIEKKFKKGIDKREKEVYNMRALNARDNRAELRKRERKKLKKSFEKPLDKRKRV